MINLKEIIPYLAISLVGIGAGAFYFNRAHRNDQLHSYKIPAPQALHVAAATVIGDHPDFLGSKNAPYTLVEFGDYECGPCRAENRLVEDLIRKNSDKIRFTFRNYPLTAIHKNAMAAAVVAESARSQGKFWQVHDALYSLPGLDASNLRQCIASAKLSATADTNNAKKAIKDDITAGKLVDVVGTPTFVLCSPDGKATFLFDLAQVNDLTH